MPFKHNVKQGECITSIAHKYGCNWETIWNDVSNANLKAKRIDPNVLYPGDEVIIPDKGVKQVQCSTGQRHRFRRKGIPVIVRLVLEDENGRPRANKPYVLEVDGELYSGNTDENGEIERRISPMATSGILQVGAEGEEEYRLQLGELDPVEEVSGVQDRLLNLGFDCGRVDGELGSKTQDALKAFQRKHGLEETGKADEATCQKLKELHRS